MVLFRRIEQFEKNMQSVASNDSKALINQNHQNHKCDNFKNLVFNTRLLFLNHKK